MDAATTTERIDVIDASTGCLMGSVPACAPADVDRAVTAFEGCAATSPAERAALLTRVADGVVARDEEFTSVMVREIGMPYSVAQGNQTGLAVTDPRSTIAAPQRFVWDKQVGQATVTREPVGAITPWNYPLHQVCAKIGPAPAAGCPVVLKPSEVAPLSAFLLAEVIDEVGLPAGVFNLVSGTGPVVGEAIAAHPLVDMVSFTGSPRAGTRATTLAAAGVKRVARELGGKSANVLLADADFETAVPRGVDDCAGPGGCATGRVSINGGAFNPFTPFGGYKGSGTGREPGRYGIEEFLEFKSTLR